MVIKIEGILVAGVKDFSKRMTKYPDIFRHATGETLHPGTLNIKVPIHIQVKEDFRIKGFLIGEPIQDLIFEVIRVNGVWGYKIRPLNLLNHLGGHGDDIIEFCTSKQMNFSESSILTIEMFR